MNTAKDALVLVCALRLALAALAKEMKERCPLCAQGIGYTGLAYLVERRGYNIDGCGAARLHAALRALDALVNDGEAS